MELSKKLTKILSIVLATALLLTVIPIAVFASPVDVFDGVESAPINKNATQTAKNFYQYLWNVRKSDSIVVGATSSSLVGADTTVADAEHDYYKALKDYFGVTPAIFAPFKKPSYQMENNYLPIVVERYKQGSIPLFHIHGVMTNYVDKMDDPADIIVNYDKTNPNRDMKLYNEWMDELKVVGDYFEAVEKAGIEVYIFKLFSEMNNTNKKGLFGKTQNGCEAFHRVWQQTVEYLTVERGLKGILFAYCPAGFTGSEPLYPGDNYVDILAPTSYANGGTGPIYSADGCQDYEWMKKRPKPFGFSELGGRGLSGDSPIGDYKETLESMIYAFPETSFAVLWYENRLSLFPTGGYTTSGNYNGNYFMYSPQVIVAEEMIDYKSSTPIESTGMASFYSKTEFKSPVLKLSLGNYNAKKLKDLSVDITKIKSLNVLHGCAVAVYESDNCTGEARLYYGSKKDVSNAFKDAKSISVIKLENVALEKDVWIERYQDSAYALNDGYNAEWSFEKDVGDDGDTIITIDLEKEYNIGQMSINHAGFYDAYKYNMRDFEVYTSLDGYDYTLVYSKYGNMLPSTNFWFNSVNARYIQLKVITPNNSFSEVEKNLLFLAEIEVYGTDKVKAVVEKADKTNISTRTSLTDTKVDNSDIGDNTYVPSPIEETGNIDTSDSTFLPDTENEDMDYGKEDIVKPDAENEEKPPVPAIVIPEFYNYVWLIFCGGVLLIAGVVCAVIILANKKRFKAPIK